MRQSMPARPPRACGRLQAGASMSGEPAAAVRSRHLPPSSPSPSPPMMPRRALSPPSRRPSRRRPSSALAVPSGRASPLPLPLPVASADIVVVGGGIIGLWCALSLLRSPENFTVALVEAEAATAGGGEARGGGGKGAPLLSPPPLPRATGAGQGYLWLAHRPPGTPVWDFAVESLAMWRAEVRGLGSALYYDASSSSSAPSAPSASSFADAAASSSSSSRRPYERTGWAARGSLLLAPEPGTLRGGGGNQAAAATGGLADCEARAAALRSAGLAGARALDSAQLRAAEPALAHFERGAGGLFVPSDVQINGRGAAADVLERCFAEGAGGGGGGGSSAKQRFSVVAGERAASLVRAFPGSPVATGVRTASGRVVSVGRAVVVAAGVWSGEFLDAGADGGGGSDDDEDAGSRRSQPEGGSHRPWRRVFAPRRGHLLEVRRPSAGSTGLPALRHGVMELSYARHYDATAAALSSRGGRPSSSSAAAAAAAAATASAASAGGSTAAAAQTGAPTASFSPSAADEELGVVFTAAPADGTGETWLVGSSREQGGGFGGNGNGGGGEGSSSSGGSDSEGGAAAAAADPLLDLSSGGAAARRASLPSPRVVEAVLRRAALFLPELAAIDPAALLLAPAAAPGSAPAPGSGPGPAPAVRVGLRPASASGMPVVGRVPSFGGSLASASSPSSSASAAAAAESNVIVAAGHEGSGLTLAPATAALVARLVAGEPERSLPAYYSALRPERALEAARRRGYRRGMR